MRRPLVSATIFLFFSGACALIYQTVWLRQFRLIFGASTAANAAVLAIFLGAIGAGSLLLARRADASDAPLGLYGRLELLIALGAVFSQVLLFLVGRLYVASGGAGALGPVAATLLRLLLAALAIGGPTLLMGGTLPAAARAVATTEDRSRTAVSMLYGANALGSVVGALVSTFVLLERFGNRWTLFAAAIVNLAVGAVALLAYGVPGEERDAGDPDEREGSEPASGAPLPFVLAAAAATGFAFLLMELVWYRMLAPVIGGTTFMFGMILAVALLGIGAGGVVYALRPVAIVPSAGTFALTCVVEAILLALPYAAGDRLAIVINQLRSLDALGFGGSIGAWGLVTGFVVFPAAFVSGMQFPMLVALLGQGRAEVGRDVGLAYACNTLGAIAGSLAGGFGLIPMLTARGCWTLSAFLLAVVALVAAGIAVRRGSGQRTALVAGGLALVAVVWLGNVRGPTAVWRHSGIGAGRAPRFEKLAKILDWMNESRREILWEADGRESSIALATSNDTYFVVNGKSDGAAHGDAGTQVMGGLVGALVHPDPKRALVIGLGTGSTAGWMAALPEISRVDVVELEPAVFRVARDLAAINQRVLDNPKVHTTIGDAREVLLTTGGQWDVIFSEPSNPYRAGVASLFTAEFYRAVLRRLEKGGIFVQWVQAYEVDERTIETIYATLDGVFGNVETWRGDASDLLLVASREPITYDVPLIARRLATRPWGEPLHVAWRAEGVEGFFSHYIANDQVARTYAARAEGINSEDRPRVEFGFARAVGRDTGFSADRLLAAAREQQAWRPVRVRGEVDWTEAMLHRASDPLVSAPPPFDIPAYKAHHDVAAHWGRGSISQASLAWRTDPFSPRNTREILALGEIAAEAAGPEAEELVRDLRRFRPAEADAVVATLRHRQGRTADSAALLVRAFERYRADPWATPETMQRAMLLAINLAQQDRSLAMRFHKVLAAPFAAHQSNTTRMRARLLLGAMTERCGPEHIESLVAFEPWPPWNEQMLRDRAECYGRRALKGLAEQAAGDLARFRALN